MATSTVLRRFMRVVAAVCLLSVFTGPREAVVLAETPRRAPDFTLTDAQGRPFQLSAQRGKVVVLDFWATWCAGCKVEIPWFVEFQKKYGPRGLVTVGVAMDDEGWAKVRPYLVEHPITYPIVIGDLDLLQNKFGLAPALPITLLIDRQGRIAMTHTGVVDRDEWERRIVELLKAR